jgi:hypothetical protein
MHYSYCKRATNRAIPAKTQSFVFSMVYLNGKYAENQPPKAKRLPTGQIGFHFGCAISNKKRTLPN